MEALQSGSNVVFVLLGAILVLFMHAGFAFLEVGTVREKNQVNALVKIFGDFGISTLAYFFIGYQVAYGTGFFESASDLSVNNGYELVKFFFLLTFAADFRRSHPSHYLGWHCRTGKVLPTAYCFRCDRRAGLPVLRRHGVEW